MEISVIVTNYNYGRFIGRCIRSILNQDIDSKNYEVIVVDDSSTDDSWEILKTFEGKIRLFRNETNLGLAATSNYGIINANGRYVVRIDSDDYVHPDFLRVILLGFDLFGRNTEAISLDYLNVTSAGEVISYGSSEKDPIACGIAFKLDAIEQVGFYDPQLRVHEEIDLRQRFLREGFRIQNINLPLYKYVRHDKSLSNQPLI